MSYNEWNLWNRRESKTLDCARTANHRLTKKSNFNCVKSNKILAVGRQFEFIIIFAFGRCSNASAQQLKAKKINNDLWSWSHTALLYYFIIAVLFIIWQFGPEKTKL